MASKVDEIRVNRAPVLTLWAAIVAERLGHDPDAAITLGWAVAGSSARVKARAIGLAEDRHEAGDMRDEARQRRERQAAAPKAVHLLGRDVPVAEENGSLRALDHDKPAAPEAAARYVERAFGDDLPAVREAMEGLARSVEPAGATHEISLVCRALAYDDAPSRWRGEQGMSIEKLGQYFVAVEDPRCSGKIEHRLVEVLVIAVCAVIACAESWDDIALYGRSKLAWLRTFLELSNGIPSHDTFRRVFMLIDPDAFEAGFAKWVGSLAGRFEREVVAIDGKTVRRSFDHGREQSPLHVVSAWASEQGLVLGQRCVDGKSNEITAVPELLDQLALGNSIVTLDAMGCQTAIAEKILARGGDYLLTFKGNHPLAHAAVVEHFDQHCFRVGAPCRAACDAFDDTHGRLVRRRVFSSTDAASLDALSGWPGLRTVLAVESIRSVNSAPTKVEAEIRYFLSSCPDNPAALGQAIRSHWAVENALHWVLDVTFREDDSRVRDRTAARNLALLRKIALNIVGRDTASKASVRARRKKAAWNDAHMLKLLVG